MRPLMVAPPTPAALGALAAIGATGAIRARTAAALARQRAAIGRLRLPGAASSLNSSKAHGGEGHRVLDLFASLACKLRRNLRAHRGAGGKLGARRGDSSVDVSGHMEEGRGVAAVVGHIHVRLRHNHGGGLVLGTAMALSLEPIERLGAHGGSKRRRRLH